VNGNEQIGLRLVGEISPASSTMRNFPVRAGTGWSDAFAANVATGAAFTEAGAACRDAAVRFEVMLFVAMLFEARVFSRPRSSTTRRYGLDSMLTEKFDPSFVSRTIRVTPATG
jgi:hypothetical protein